MARWSARPCLVIVLIGLAACDAAHTSARRASPEKPPERILSSSAERRGISVFKALAADPSGIAFSPALFVTHKGVLDRFTFAEVMEQIVCERGAGCTPGAGEVAARALFRQWWSTQNLDAPDPAERCRPRLADAPYQCPRDEGRQREQDPFAPDPAPTGYDAIGLFNRIDLADRDGGDCGEYRIVFARRSGRTDRLQRVLINFEAVIPNPNPSAGLAGCQPVARFWSELRADDPALADKLKTFYFNGLPGDKIGPVVHRENYGARTCTAKPSGRCSGQVRTNQFMGRPWVLREFVVQGACPPCAIRMTPAPVGDNPFGGLFDDRDSQHVKTSAFRQAMAGAVSALARPGTINDFCWGARGDCDNSLADFNGAESLIASGRDNDYPHQFRSAPAAFVDALRTALGPTGVRQPEQIVARALALSCAGCHQLSNDVPDLGGGLTWPAKVGMDFVHVDERSVGSGADEMYPISNVLRTHFLPHRAAKLAYVLSLRPPR